MCSLHFEHSDEGITFLADSSVFALAALHSADILPEVRLCIEHFIYEHAADVKFKFFEKSEKIGTVTGSLLDVVKSLPRDEENKGKLLMLIQFWVGTRLAAAFAVLQAEFTLKSGGLRGDVQAEATMRIAFGYDSVFDGIPLLPFNTEHRLKQALKARCLTNLDRRGSLSAALQGMEVSHARAGTSPFAYEVDMLSSAEAECVPLI